MRLPKPSWNLRRPAALLLSLCMILSLFSGIGGMFSSVNAAASTGSDVPTDGVTRQADPSTMDTYQKMLDFTENTRYAGRLWSDKTVFALEDNTHDNDKDWDGKTLTLNPQDDGVKNTASITLDEDFLHVYSVLGSSMEFVGVPPVRTVIVFDNSGSMYNSQDEWINTRIAKTVAAINNAIDILMLSSQYNEVSVVLFGDGANNGDTVNGTQRYHGNSTAVTILPMKHYEPSLTAQNDYKNDGKIESGNVTQYLQAGWSKNPEDTSQS